MERAGLGSLELSQAVGRTLPAKLSTNQPSAAMLLALQIGMSEMARVGWFMTGTDYNIVKNNGL